MRIQKQQFMNGLLAIACILLLLTGCKMDQVTPPQDENTLNHYTSSDKKFPRNTLSLYLERQTSLAKRHAEKGLLLHQAQSVETLKREIDINPNIAQDERGSSSYKIYPTGMFPDDWVNIQAVTDHAGLLGQDAKVLLKAKNTHGVPTVFNFGFGDIGENTGAFVTVSGTSSGQSGSIRYQGVGSEDGGTTISGGIAYPFPFFPIHQNIGVLIEDRESVEFKNIQFVNNCGLRIEMAPAPHPGDITVKNCRFDNYTGWPIAFWGTTGSTTIRNNTFLNYRGNVSVYNNPNGCIIQNNLFNTSGLGGLELINTGGTVVERNDITTRVTDFDFAIGILVTSSNPTSPAFILDNDVTSESQGISCFEFLGSMRDVVVQGNTIEIAPNPLSSFRIPFATNSNGGTIENICFTDNTASGTGYWAVEIASQATFFGGAFGDLSNIVIAGNDLEGFNSVCESDYLLSDLGLTDCVDIFLDATVHDSYVCEEDVDIADLGTDNTVSDDDDDCPECD